MRHGRWQLRGVIEASRMSTYRAIGSISLGGEVPFQTTSLTWLGIEAKDALSRGRMVVRRHVFTMC
jgi:hypothetical protein